jgi:arsenical pump membrane protein
VLGQLERLAAAVVLEPRACDEAAVRMLAHAALASANQSWPPFVLVAGLILIGAVAAEDGLSEALGAQLAGTRLSAHSLLFALLALVAAVTAVLNLDTSVVFLTPVLVHAARQRNLDERPFLYGSVFMANAASVLLPGSNLTNLLVLRSDPQSGAAFAARMLPAWIVACMITGGFDAIAFRLEDGERNNRQQVRLRIGLGAAATLAAATFVVTLPNAALPVLVVGVAVTAVRRIRPQLDARVLAPLFVLAVALGTIARLWRGPAHLLDSSGTWAAAGIGVVASVLINNLPAAVLLSAKPATHPYALLLGLNLGPNLAITGSLSAFLWLQAARTVNANASASITTYSRLGQCSYH